MNRAGFVVFLSLMILAGLGCEPLVAPGEGLLPEGIEEAQVPDVDSAGYIYFNSSLPATLTGDFFFQDGSIEETAIALDSATMLLGADSRAFGGLLEFESDKDVQQTWALFQEHVASDRLWGKLSNPSLMLAAGEGDWSTSVKASFESENLVAIKDHDPVGWELMSNLPSEPPTRPVAAGVLKLENGVIDVVGDLAEVDLDNIGEAFGLVRVDSLAFAFYTDEPVEITSTITRDYLNDSNSALLFVSQSGYPSALVSYMLSVMADKTRMELISMGRTNARYQSYDGLHLILKNKGSLLYGTIAANQDDAEQLMISALFGSDQN